MNLSDTLALLEMPAEAYHAHPAVGHTGLVKVSRSPAHFKEYRDNPPEPTPAKAFGHAIHAAILEPAVFQSQYAVFDESLLVGILQSLDDYKVTATVLGIKFDALNKDELKAAIKAADTESRFRFRDDVQAELNALAQERLTATLQSLDDYKAAAAALGIDTARMKKDELKAAIQAADSESRFRFREDVQAEMAELSQERLAGALQSLDDFKAAAAALGVRYDALNKDEIRAAIKVADTESRFRFREDEIARIYDGMSMLTLDQMIAIQGMQASIAWHAGATRLLTSGMAELSAFWVDEETGVHCKCRPDFLALKPGTEWQADNLLGIVDVKSCCDASVEGFGRSIATYGYDVQAAYYQDGIYQITGLRLPFYFLAIEKDAPNAVAVYRASEAMIEVGRKKYRAALQLMHWCGEHGYWPGYQPSGEIEDISLPGWAANFDLEA
jgi:hypothetical protein